MLTRKVSIIFGGLIAVFLAGCLFFLKANRDLKGRIHRVESLNRRVVTQKLEVAREKVKKNLEEKYHDDSVSFRSMYERIKLQKPWIENTEK